MGDGVRRAAGVMLRDRTFAALFGVAFLLLAAEALVSAAFSALPALGLGLACASVGTVGFTRVERKGGPRSVVVYFAVQLALCTAVVYASRGAPGAIFVLVVVAGQAARTPGWPWAMAVWGSAILVHSLATPHAPLAARVRDQLVLISLMVLAVAFGWLAGREQRARGGLDEANRRLAEYALRAEELATVQERNRLAREIHDGLGHYLGAISMQIKAARATLNAGDGDRANAALGKAEGMTREALSDVRRSVGALRQGATNSRPLSEALAELAQESGELALPVSLVVLGEPRFLPPQQEQALYRATQEGLNNARKHSGATHAAVELDYRHEGLVRLSVGDEGFGSEAVDNGGFGLLGLRERVALLGGTVEIETAPGRGFRVRVEVPG